MSEIQKVLGIDLGTTNSVLTIIQDGTPTLLPIQGKNLLPSVVGIASDGDVLVGAAARNQWVVSPDRTIRSIKRLMGRDETVSMAGSFYSPQEISAFILREIKDAAEEALGHPVQQAVITVPAYFNEVQRQATLEAGEIAGLTVERIINEPTAAALAHGYGVGDDAHLRVLVYDLGGGTFDVSLIELNYGIVDVLATAGDNQLGGDDFDEALAIMLADEFKEEHGVDLREDHQAWARLLRTAEETKIKLSSAPYTMVSLEYISQDRKGQPLHIRREVSRQEFVEQISELLDQTISCIEQALSDANLQASDIDRVLLVGGSTRIPAVQELVSGHMEQDPHTEIDPDAAVALGAAVQGGIISGEEIDAILVDVTPLSLGIETADYNIRGHLQDDRFTPLIQRNTTIPVQKSELFTTVYPGQEKIKIKVYQGESKVASKNVLLGDFMVEELQAADDDGFAEVTVHFQLDVNAILNITVTDRATGKQVTEKLKADRQRLSPDQIAASQAKLSAVHEPDEADLSGIDPGISALLGRAQTVLGQPNVDPELVQEMKGIISNLEAAVAENNDEQIEELCDDLVDLLMEAEEEA